MIAKYVDLPFALRMKILWDWMMVGSPNRVMGREPAFRDRMKAQDELEEWSPEEIGYYLLEIK